MWSEHDRATGLTVIKARPPDVAEPSPWAPRLPEQPRYLFAAQAGPDGPSMRPLFIDSLSPTDSPLWPPPVWLPRSEFDARPGTFMFTADGLFAGLVVEMRGRKAIVPGDAVLREAERVRQAGYKTAGRLDIEVRMLTPSLTSAIGEASGVVVAWVDPAGAAVGKLAAGDLVEAVDGALVPTIEHWVARTARLAPKESVVLHVRRAAGRLRRHPDRQRERRADRTRSGADDAGEPRCRRGDCQRCPRLGGRSRGLETRRPHHLDRDGGAPLPARCRVRSQPSPTAVPSLRRLHVAIGTTSSR